MKFDMLMQRVSWRLLKPIVCNSHRVLVAHFEDMASPDRSTKPSPSLAGLAKKVLSLLLDHESVLFIHFMCDVLEHLSVVSQAFQRDDLTVCQAQDSQERCFLELVGLKSTRAPEMAKVAQDVERTGTYKGVILHKVGTTTLLVMRKLDLAAFGKDQFKKLAQHYNKLLQRAGTSCEEAEADFALYKSYAKSQTHSTITALLDPSFGTMWLAHDVLAPENVKEDVSDA
ncbi:unnamed protein product [Boreogadus saida]